MAWTSFLKPPAFDGDWPNYDGLRALISPDVTSLHVSDAYLGQLPIAPEAEKTVIRKLKAEDLDIQTDERFDENAADYDQSLVDDVLVLMMHESMDILCLTVPQLLEQSEIEVSTQVQLIDWEKKRAFHIGEAIAKLAEIIAIAASTVPTVQGRQLPFGPVGTKRPPENRWR